jgi:hypothetical protein
MSHVGTTQRPPKHMGCDLGHHPPHGVVSTVFEMSPRIALAKSSAPFMSFSLASWTVGSSAADAKSSSLQLGLNNSPNCSVEKEAIGKRANLPPKIEVPRSCRETQQSSCGDVPLLNGKADLETPWKQLVEELATHASVLPLSTPCKTEAL